MKNFKLTFASLAIVSLLSLPPLAQADSTVGGAMMAAPGGAMAALQVTCKDGAKSKAGQGACSGHGGVDKTANASAAAGVDPAQAKADAKAAKAKAKADAKAAKDSAKTQASAAAAAPAAAASSAKASATGAAAGAKSALDSNPAGATAKCKDGSYSHSKGHSGACSHHGGVDSFL